MTTKLLVAMQNSLLIVESSNNNGWKKSRESLKGLSPQCVAFDPSSPNRAYCGTSGKGLYKTDDGGKTWDSFGKITVQKKNEKGNDNAANRGSNNGITTADITSVSVSHLQGGRKNKFNTVYVGTEPTALYKSEDGGESWERMSALNNLRSSSIWSFPPRPWTSHVCWIEPDKTNPDYIFVAIEAGALVQSHDGGKTWVDKADGGPYDTHTLATHKKTPKKLYSSAGDGYFESFDYGQSWKLPRKGLRHHYLAGLVVDSDDPNTVLISASQSAWEGQYIEDAKSVVYRRTTASEEWNLVSNGLPEPNGTIISVLAANPKVAGEFYALNNRGIFCSTELGISWEKITENKDIEWPKEYLSQHPRALAVQTGE
jgi:photosystem II stability/assembly factor-like uncharacterized protein